MKISLFACGPAGLSVHVFQSDLSCVLPCDHGFVCDAGNLFDALLVNSTSGSTLMSVSESIAIVERIAGVLLGLTKDNDKVCFESRIESLLFALMSIGRCDQTQFALLATAFACAQNHSRTHQQYV